MHSPHAEAGSHSCISVLKLHCGNICHFRFARRPRSQRSMWRAGAGSLRWSSSPMHRLAWGMWTSM